MQFFFQVLLEIQSLMGQMCDCLDVFLVFWKRNGNLNALPLSNFTAAGLLPQTNFILVSTACASSLFPSAVVNCDDVMTCMTPSQIFPECMIVNDNERWKGFKIFILLRQGSPLSVSQRQRQVQSSFSWLSELIWMQAFTLSRMAEKLQIVSAQRKAKLDPCTNKHMLVGIQEHPVFSLAIFWVGSKDFPLCFL